jgi:hypothetical protein
MQLIKGKLGQYITDKASSTEQQHYDMLLYIHFQAYYGIISMRFYAAV